mmetsp:Transcript_2065/g.6156  ORF Transcript_2065/g.6156 Transcript_2065/m.6156 type:complete len:206 (+) Transcript_2065:823-1440(+)
MPLLHHELADGLGAVVEGVGPEGAGPGVERRQLVKHRAGLVFAVRLVPIRKGGKLRLDEAVEAHVDGPRVVVYERHAALVKEAPLVCVVAQEHLRVITRVAALASVYQTIANDVSRAPRHVVLHEHRPVRMGRPRGRACVLHPFRPLAAHVLDAHPARPGSIVAQLREEPADQAGLLSDAGVGHHVPFAPDHEGRTKVGERHRAI